MTGWVVDASVAAKWVVQEDFSDQAAKLLAGQDLHAPAHWLAESVNVLWAKTGRGELSGEGAASRAALLRLAPVRPWPLAGLAEPALGLSLRVGISVYDSLYLALAQSIGCRFVTADRRLLRKVPASMLEAGGGYMVWVEDVR